MGRDRNATYTLTSLSASRRAASGDKETPSPCEHKRRAEPTNSQQDRATAEALGFFAPAAPPTYSFGVTWRREVSGKGGVGGVGTEARRETTVRKHAKGNGNKKTRTTAANATH